MAKIKLISKILSSKIQVSLSSNLQSDRVENRNFKYPTEMIFFAVIIFCAIPFTLGIPRLTDRVDTSDLWIQSTQSEGSTNARQPRIFFLVSFFFRFIILALKKYSILKHLNQNLIFNSDQDHVCLLHCHRQHRGHLLYHDSCRNNLHNNCHSRKEKEGRHHRHFAHFKGRFDRRFTDFKGRFDRRFAHFKGRFDRRFGDKK